MSITVSELVEKLQKFDGKAEVLMPRSMGWEPIYGVEETAGIYSTFNEDEPKTYVTLI